MTLFNWISTNVISVSPYKEITTVLVFLVGLVCFISLLMRFFSLFRI